LLATVTGKDFPAAADAAIQAITRGRLNEAVTRLFGGLDAPTLNTEAVRRGLAETTEEVTQYTRYLLLMQMAQEEAARVGGKLALVQEDISGKVTQEAQDLVDLKKEVGEELLPAKLAWYKITLKLLEAFGWLIDRIQEFGRHIGSRLWALIATTIEGWKAMWAAMRGEDFDFRWMDTFIEKQKELFEWSAILQGDARRNYDDFTSSVVEGSEKAGQAVEDLADKFKDAFAKIREMIIDMKESIVREIDKFNQMVLDNEAKFALKLEQLYEKLQLNIGKVYRQFNDKIAEANDDYRDKEIEAEEKYQEKLRKLREQFLFDLEDALHERDARQIMRLIRQYNLRKTQLERERTLETEENKRNLQEQLEDIKRQRAARLRELQLEYQFRRDQMIAQETAEIAFRQQQHDRRIAEIKQRTRERFAEFLRSLQDQGKLTAKEAKIMADVFDDFFGDGGVMEGSVDDLITIFETASDVIITEIAKIKDALSGLDRALQARRDVSLLNVVGAPAEQAHDVDAIRGELLQVHDVDAIRGSLTKVTDVFDEEFGDDGEVIGIFARLSERLKEFMSVLIPESLKEDGGITLAAQGVSDLLGSYFGEKGVVEGVFDYLVGMIGAAVDAVVLAIQKLRNALAGLSRFGSAGPSTAPAPIPMAEGGTLLATKPTLALFGEAGPEVATFTPLSKTMGKIPSGLSKDSSRSDKVEMLVRMEEGLVAEIIDTTLDQTATVVLNVERSRYGRV